MNTFNFLLSALSLVSAASSVSSNGTKEIEIKDNVNYVLKLGTCDQKAEFEVKIKDGTENLPYLYPKFETGDATVATKVFDTKLASDLKKIASEVIGDAKVWQYVKELSKAAKDPPAAEYYVNSAKYVEVMLKAGLDEQDKLIEQTEMDGIKAAAKKVNGVDFARYVKEVLITIDTATKNDPPKADKASDFKTDSVANNPSSAEKAVEKTHTETSEYTKHASEIKKALNTLKEFVDIDHAFPGHFKIADFKFNAINFTGNKTTNYEVYVTPPNAHESANIKSPVTFDVDVNFICGADKNETTKYKFTVTSNARAVSLVSSAAVLAATFFLIL
ncbi:hypothetical protein DSO57_1005624 [Entomophthora muscae]|uniref:Uncharacterized protein n=1 Tax=Entomophthora muscae TaxID=34485 RepID=A0ACC2RMQ7_9FUNG|nr:hypothetical protein DSO57_1005624 [Entomophthora muscae]